jgi:N-acetyl sugar amidotransferase
MKYCDKCLMPDTRPGIVFENGICNPCINYEKQKTTNWPQRMNELKSICDKYRNCNGNNYDCAIAVSGGKDSHFQVYYMKEVLKMNPVLISSGVLDWTETGRKNLENLSDTFSCDIIMFNPNRNVSRKMLKKAFVEIGQPTWYHDALLYAFPYRMTMQLGLKFLIYGEDVNYTYGGKYSKETPSAMLQPLNDVVKPIWDKWLEDGDITEKELNAAKVPSIEECKKNNLDPIYLGYFVPWDTHHNYEVAKKYGFRHLDHEYVREGTLENYNQIDSIGYLLGQYLKYPKFGHSAATEMASRWIRSGMKTRQEMIPFVKEFDHKLDQGIVDKFLEFTGVSVKEFWSMMDKWYNTDLFKQDEDGIWHEKFEVGIGIMENSN